MKILTRVPSAIPFGPSATFCTICGVGKHVITISQTEATPAGDAADFAPSFSKSRTIAASVSKTVNGNPAATRRRARRPPIFPTPIKPKLSSDIPQLLEHFPSEPETVHSRRNANIDGNLQKHFLDLVFRYTVRKGAAHMRFNLMRP